MNRLFVYWHMWKLHAHYQLQLVMINRAASILFTMGKLIRLGMTLFFLFLVRQQVKTIAGFTTDQIIVFFLTYNLLDAVAQTLYRGVYSFSGKIRDGNFDYNLIQPINILFQSLATNPDILDALLLIPNLILTIGIISTLHVTITVTSLLWYVALLANSLLIITAIHIVVISIGVITTEVDNIIWLYRDVSRLGQFPVVIYTEPVRLALFFLVPIGMMITIPAQVLLNTQPSYPLAVTTAIGIGSLWTSLKIWQYSLRKYASASS